MVYCYLISSPCQLPSYHGGHKSCPKQLEEESFPGLVDSEESDRHGRVRGSRRVMEDPQITVG